MSKKKIRTTSLPHWQGPIRPSFICRWTSIADRCRITRLSDYTTSWSGATWSRRPRRPIRKTPRLTIGLTCLYNVYTRVQVTFFVFFSRRPLRLNAVSFLFWVFLLRRDCKKRSRHRVFGRRASWCFAQDRCRSLAVAVFLCLSTPVFRSLGIQWTSPPTAVIVLWFVWVQNRQSSLAINYIKRYSSIVANERVGIFV